MGVRGTTAVLFTHHHFQYVIISQHTAFYLPCYFSVEGEQTIISVSDPETGDNWGASISVVVGGEEGGTWSCWQLQN